MTDPYVEIFSWSFYRCKQRKNPTNISHIWTKKVFNKTTISQQYPGKKQFNLEDYPEVPAQVRVILWLGLEKHQEAWTNRQDIEGDFCVFAETVRLN